MKNFLKKFLFFITIVISLIIVAFIIIKYDAEGEKTLPFSISKILLVSTVNGDIVDDPNNIWNINITQVNDVYMYIDKTQETDETIKEIKLENFIINTMPQKGNVKLLRPTGELSNLYTYSEQDYLNSEIVYQGSAIDDMKSLEIANNGGVLGFRFALDDLGNYISNENQEIIYDGNLLKNLGISLEEIKFSVSFDIIITTSDDINYKGTINLEMPIDTIIEEGSSHKEITGLENIVFKRV
ncbi:hypothetical protein [uncultured Clostridium sp.]|uniref:hypothetical protein n=1 Tax=uncultured Clostridium sp. TaxID=59620 RepID=UPI0026EDBD66|nr:hypothetical protein [uncultured Clostridium sp.]